MKVCIVGFETYPEWERELLNLFQRAQFSVMTVGEVDLAVYPLNLARKYVPSLRDKVPWVGIWVDRDFWSADLLSVKRPPAEIFYWPSAGVMAFCGKEFVRKLHTIVQR